MGRCQAQPRARQTAPLMPTPFARGSRQQRPCQYGGLFELQCLRSWPLRLAAARCKVSRQPHRPNPHPSGAWLVSVAGVCRPVMCRCWLNREFCSAIARSAWGCSGSERVRRSQWLLWVEQSFIASPLTLPRGDPPAVHEGRLTPLGAHSILTTPPEVHGRGFECRPPRARCQAHTLFGKRDG